MVGFFYIIQKARMRTKRKREGYTGMVYCPRYSKFLWCAKYFVASNKFCRECPHLEDQLSLPFNK